MKGISVLVLIFAIDAVVGLAQGNNMYSLKPGGATGYVVDAATLAVSLVLGPGLWRLAQRRAMHRAMQHYRAHEHGLITEGQRDRLVAEEMRDFT